MKRSLNQLAEIAQQAVRIGNDLIRTTRPKAVIEKSDRDTVTDVDVQIERKVRAYLAAATPEIGFIGEEEGRGRQGPESSLYWALDPIDGTSNFAHGVPLCAIQLALIEEQEAVAGAISLPYIDTHYWVARGLGAFANDSPIKVSKTVALSRAIVAIGDYATGECATQKNLARIKITSMLADKVERIRMFGSAAHDLAWVADGRIDAAIILSNNPLDIAVGALLAREAGASVTDTSGSTYGLSSPNIVAATPAIARQLDWLEM